MGRRVGLILIIYCARGILYFQLICTYPYSPPTQKNFNSVLWEELAFVLGKCVAQSTRAIERLVLGVAGTPWHVSCYRLGLSCSVVGRVVGPGFAVEGENLVFVYTLFAHLSGDLHHPYTQFWTFLH